MEVQKPKQSTTELFDCLSKYFFVVNHSSYGPGQLFSVLRTKWIVCDRTPSANNTTWKWNATLGAIHGFVVRAFWPDVSESNR
jgi:hypothetical protein